MNRQEKAVALIQASPTLQEIIQVEPLMEHLMQLAIQQTDGRVRWHSYDELKQAGARLAGWQARHPQLATRHHYDAMCDAIEALLPDEESEETN